MKTWADRHPIIAGVAAVVGFVLLLFFGFLALFLLIEVLADIGDDFWKLTEK